MSSEAKHLYEFGPFRLNTAERRLLRDGQPVALTPKAFDTLLVLVSQSGHVVEKDELMERVWPGTVVEESTLTQNIFTLRKILGEGASAQKYIETVPKHGYRFVVSVRELSSDVATPPVQTPVLPRIATVEEEPTDAPAKTESLVGPEAARASRAPDRRGGWRHHLAWFAAFVLLGGLTVALFYFWISRAKESETMTGTRVLAVLPFKPINAQRRDAYLELGMADALITKLSRISRIIVRPTSAVRKYTELEQDPVAAGREQGVEAVLDAHIQELDDRMRVTARLVSVKDGQALWSGAFEVKSTDRFVLQDALAEQMTRALALKLTPQEKERLTKHDTEDLIAYQLYQKGQYFWNRRTEDDLKKSVEYFHQAIERDPNYALAYAGLADSYIALGIHETSPSREAYLKAKEAARKAMAMDDTLAEAYTALARVMQAHDWDWPGAEREYKRALALNPNYAIAHHWYGLYLDAMGRTAEALVETQRSQELDPRSPIIASGVGLVLYHARRYDPAIEQYRKVLEIDHAFARARWFLGLAYEQKAMPKEAIAEFQAAIRSGGGPFSVAALGHAYAISGRKDEAQQVLRELIATSKERYVSPYAIATVYLGLGEKDQALIWLEKAYADRSEVFIWLKVEPLLDGLRSDPRFADLLRRVGLPP